MKVVPASEAWVHEPEVQYQLGKAAKWLKKAPRSETSVDALARKGRKLALHRDHDGAYGKK